MRSLSVARLRQLAMQHKIELSEEDLIGLRPMVEDLLAVAQHLRQVTSDRASDERLGTVGKPIIGT